MDGVLCDKLLQEIFQILPPSSSSSSVSLVSKRWLYLYRSSRTALSLRLASHFSVIPSLISLLSHYPCLSSLSLILSSDSTSTAFSDVLLLAVSSCCSRLLRSLRFLAGPVSASSLVSLSAYCARLNSHCISLSRPISLMRVLGFPCLKELSIVFCSVDSHGGEIELNN